MSAPTSGS